ncbi:MAG: site-specific integrase [Candidatus Pacebacteria bacterium]|nr:site-specific integrase [Candidatus Paceibacterota bacterium]
MRTIKDETVTKFLRNLQSEGKSPISIKNYKSDIFHFLGWAYLKIKSFGSVAESVMEIVPFVNNNFFVGYKNYMIENNTKTKTINRRLSSLRNFSGFLHSEGFIDQNFMQGIQNVGIGIVSKVQKKTQDIVEAFRESLTEDKKVSANTIKNYTADARSFLAWIDKKGDLPNAY